MTNTKKLGYGRVSTYKQDLDIQIGKLLECGVNEEDIYIEKQSGKNRSDREELKKLLNYVRQGDHIYVTKIDRLARSIIDLNTIVNELFEKGVSVTFIEDAMTFKANEKRDPLQTLLFNTLGSFAQFERDMIIARTSEGRMKAIKNGKKLGRKGQPSQNIKEAIYLYNNKETKELSVSDIVKLTGVPRSSIYAEIKKLTKLKKEN